jgi:hypothetical protein
VEEGRLNGEDERKRIWSMDFVYMYENRAMKSVEIDIRRGDERE